MAFKGRRGRPLIYGVAFGNVSAEQALGQLIDGLRAVKDAGDRVADGVVGDLIDLQDSTIADGTDAYGQLWALTQAGEVPLQNAAAAVKFRVVGSRVFVELEGVEVAHHIGFARGYRGGTKMRRPIIPEPRKGIPKDWQDALSGVAGEVIGVSG